MFNSLLMRPVVGWNSPKIHKTAVNSKGLVRRFALSDRLVGHTGCVNTISWNKSGSLIISGSDDLDLKIFRVSPNEVVDTYSTEHTANIFSAKFLNDDAKAISCSAAGMVMAHDFVSRKSVQFSCHNAVTYEVIVVPGSFSNFLCCSEDGTVRLFDIRQKNHSSCTNCYENILINMKDKELKKKASVTSISINPLEPVYLAAACSDSVVRIFDRRMAEATRPVSTLCPDHLLHKKRKVFSNNRVTSLEYDSNGKELLVSYSSEYVYLFKLKEEGKRSCFWPQGPGPTSTMGESTSDDNGDSGAALPRIRLSSDWSDTGPVDNSEGVVMQRVSMVFERWLGQALENSERTNRRRQNEMPLRVEEEGRQGSSSEPAVFYSADESEGIDSDSIAGQQSDASEYFTPVGILSQSPNIGRRRTRTFVRPAVSSGREQITPDEASQRLGRFWRRHRSNPNESVPEEIFKSQSKGKEREVCNESNILQQCASADKLIPELKMCYKGHRNVRTLIKEASFVGDKFIASGSDDGRVFLWEKDTGKIVNVLLGDTRVVNCVQGHPTSPIIASSGIDNDIKIWEPIGEEPYMLADIDKITERNERLLCQGQNVMVVSASFMLGMLEAINSGRANLDTIASAELG
eukprot:Nk52_evm11s232 gene=Nk52_evmTU11s232